MNKNILRALSLCLCAVLLFALTGCGDAGGNAPAAGDTATGDGGETAPADGGSTGTATDGDGRNKLGFFFPLTGDLSQYGIKLRNGAELALEQYNEAHGTNYVAVFEDDKGDQKEAVNVANKIVSDPTVIAGLGSYNSSCAMAAAPVFEDSGMLLLSPTASHADFPSMGDLIFSCAISQKYEGALFADAVYEKFGSDAKIAIIYQNTDLGVNHTELFTSRWNELGGEIVASEAFVTGQTKDFSPILSKIKTSQPDVLYISASYNDGAQIFLQANTLDLNAAYVGPAALLQQEFLDIVGTQLDGTTCLATNPCFLPSVLENTDLDAKSEAFVATYLEKYGELPDGYASQGFDAVNILLDCVERVGTDSQALRDEIASLRDFEGVSGYNMYFNDNKEMIKGIFVFEIQDGNFVRTH